MAGFLDPTFLLELGPNQFPRQIERLLWHIGFTDVVNIDGSGDEGGDVIGRHKGHQWVLQCKWKARGAVGAPAVDEVARAKDVYRATKAAVVTNTRVSADASRRTDQLALVSPRIQLWPGTTLSRAFDRAAERFGKIELRPYQQEARDALNHSLENTGRALLILATGLGKTVVSGEVINDHLSRFPHHQVLVVAHTKDLVDQLERALWRHLSKSVKTRLLTGERRPDDLNGVTCATLDSALFAVRRGYRPGLVVVDEAHHVGENGQYSELLGSLSSSRHLGVTATPWRGDAYDITHRFGPAAFTLGIEKGMRRGYLAQVDYRLFVDNLDWDVVRQASENSYSLGELNSKLFLPQRDEAIRDELAAIWGGVAHPRALVFCRTIEHAERMADLLRRNGRWSDALAVHAGLTKRKRQSRLLAFRAGTVPILTSVDILNEGVDVPDVNILCFARVTHSRRIFVQQLGRGLRLRQGKSRVTVLDFVSDLRRIAAALNIKRELDAGETEVLQDIGPSTVEFSDQRVGTLMDEWIKDAASLETKYDEARLQFPDPYLNSGW
ncbi:DEAD/DEAH box helicase family protein [Microbispora triticiradicis]|uniref:DEAD/DEAH box helicase family protein n=1 Tax=Microbispora triticiradicis TaxID=2200763 RepID=UPI001AD7A432|nr:DEAD/DEAH box helicase family protein [Microbispora triticiradicis]MBO4269089.1 DEAD/DEAH box helicase family protein [Microbispora triticiradicis]